MNQPDFLPRALFDKFNIEFLATTDAISDLDHHEDIKNSGWNGQIIPTYRPDSVVDPEFTNFKVNLQRLAELTGRILIPGVGILLPTVLVDHLKMGQRQQITVILQLELKTYQNLKLKNCSS